MFNRRIFMKAAAMFSGAATATATTFATPAAAADKQQVAYHVSEKEKVGFVLANIRNHIKGVGGPENAEIIFVAHGPALKQFHKFDGNASILDHMTKLMGNGVQFNACGNTMRALSYQADDLIEGAVRVDQGGVVRLAELQQAGFLYLRP